MIEENEESDDPPSNEDEAEIQLEAIEDDNSDKLRKTVSAMLVVLLAVLFASPKPAESQRSLK